MMEQNRQPTRDRYVTATIRIRGRTSISGVRAGLSEQAVRATVIGEFAYHRSEIAPLRRWIVTHVPSGCAVGPSVRSAQKARILIAQLRGAGLDWDFAEPKSMSAATRSAALAILCEFHAGRSKG